MSERNARARRRVLATTSAFALAAAGLVAFGSSIATAAPTNTDAPPPTATIGADEYYMNYVAPRAEEAFDHVDDTAVATAKGVLKTPLS
ncbi:MAG: hypothetical protein J0H73_10370, partial [Salana multivorans]|nr:hypothetical protein [Salana multivorans]